MSDDRAASNLRKRRGTVRGSITRLGHRLKDLEGSPPTAGVVDHAKQLVVKLEALDADFTTLHLKLIDLLDNSDDLEHEQETLDVHDEEVLSLTVRLQQLIAKSRGSVATPDSCKKAPSRKLSRLERSLSAAEDFLNTTSGTPADVSLLEQHAEQLLDYKKELSAVYENLVSLDLKDDDDLFILHAQLEKTQFSCAHKARKLLSSHSSSSTSAPAADYKGVKLPKLEVPNFDGDILHWKQFWEQFSVSVHDRSHLSNAEKLVYLQQSVRSGSAKTVIEGLSRSGEHYLEAVECLLSRYDRLRLIHRAHVCKIVDAPSLKDGSGKELRRLHDILQQHLRALKAMKCEPDGSFITSVIELKLDGDTMFEWQKHSQDKKDDVPHYLDILNFLDLRAQASETTLVKKPTRSDTSTSKSGKTVTTFTASSESSNNCIVCVSERHPLYLCRKFKLLSHSDKLSTVKANKICINCFKNTHFVQNCTSSQRCKKCGRCHHTLLHVETDATPAPTPAGASPSSSSQVTSNAAVKLKSSSLLMTCRVLVAAPNGSSMEARALLDNASSASFVSERLAQNLSLPRVHHSVRVSGIAGSSPTSPIQSVATIRISPAHCSGSSIEFTAIVVPKHISDLPLADPSFGQPGRIDILLGVDLFVDVLLHGRRTGPPGTPAAFETKFGWVLSGTTAQEDAQTNFHATAFHSSVTHLSGDDILRQFWEIEETPLTALLSMEERAVMRHFESTHRRTAEGRFVVSLPKKTDAGAIGESRTQAVRRFRALERSLTHKGRFPEFSAVMQEYLALGHAERVPVGDIEKGPSEVFYLPMHAVYKASSSTTKVRAVFDASAKSSSGVSLNDTLQVGPTVHPPLIDVLLRFRMHRIALIADISKMYRAVELVEQDLHRFVWRSKPEDVLQDYRMTRVTFGVSASCFAANMAVKQNAIDFAHEFPLAAKAVDESFYVDDCLTGADDVKTAISLQSQLQDLFARGGFLLRKWNSNEVAVLHGLASELCECQDVHPISDSNGHTKTLGLEWNTATDQFHLTIAELPSCEVVTKRILASDIAKVFDVLGWFSPATIHMKILLQRLWERSVDWDEAVPGDIEESWRRWRSELPDLTAKGVPRCYFPKDVTVRSIQLHGFSDASENAYAGVVYLCIADSAGQFHVVLVTSKTKVSPIKRLSIPRLELCGPQVLARLLFHVKEVLHLPVSEVFAWTDSTIVLSWLVGNPRRFKTFVGNRVSLIVDQIPPDRWNHVLGGENPADCASRGLYPSELLQHDLWWNGPPWLRLPSSNWPKSFEFTLETHPEEEREVCLATMLKFQQSIVPLNRYPTFSQLHRVTAWVFRFLDNCRLSKNGSRDRTLSPSLSVSELDTAERYWFSLAQEAHLATELSSLRADKPLSKSTLLPLHPFLDSDGLLRVGGREGNAKLRYSQMHPIVLHGRHRVSKLIIQSEHLRLLHAGPTLLSASLSRRFHIVYLHKTIRSITRQCVTCRRQTLRPQPQLMRQLPLERVTPGSVFDKVGVDYAGPFLIKYGMVRRPTLVKAYLCVFVSLTVKAVHLELVSDLTSEAFIATLRRFIARRGHPTLIWSDNSTNFVGANRQLKELQEFLVEQRSEGVVSEFCTARNVEWRFIPEHAPNFGGLWEAAVKSAKTHLKRIMGPVKLTFEELTTVLTQVEACLNSRPLVPLSSHDDDGIEVLTPGHFLIGQPLCALPDPSISFKSTSLLRRWHLCQSLLRHFWQRWSGEYLSTLNKFNKWHFPSRNLTVGDVVVLREDSLLPTKWLLARIVEVHPGRDGLVRVATVKTPTGIYKRPVSKIALLLPHDEFMEL